MIDSQTKNGEKIFVSRDSLRAGGKEGEEVSKKLRVGPLYTVSEMEMIEGTWCVWVHEIPGIKFLAAHFNNTRPKKQIHFLSGLQGMIGRN